MQSELVVFNNEEFGRVRAVEVDGKPYVVANDVLKALGYAKANWRTTLSRKCKGVAKCNVPHSQKAIRDHCKGENETVLPTKGGNQIRKTSGYIPLSQEDLKELA